MSIGADASFTGTILSGGAITVGANALLFGRALSYGAITLAANTITFTTQTPPVVTIDGGASAVTKTATPIISGTTNALAGTTVTVKVAGQVLTTTVLSNGTWAVTTTALISGSYTVMAVVRDAAGNAGSASQTLTVEINSGPVVLGAAATYSVLAVTSVTSTGATSLSGDLGVSPAGTITGFGPGTVAGSIYLNDSASAQGVADMVTAYNNVKARTTGNFIDGDLAGRTFNSGVYYGAAAITLSTSLTLDAQGDPNAVFIFQVNAAFATAAASSIVLVNGAQASNVFWQVTGAMSIGADASFTGTILSGGAITVGANALLFGRALSYGTVTLAANTITFN